MAIEDVKITLHDLDHPKPKRFATLDLTLQYCWANKVSGYIHIWPKGEDPQIINLHKGKREAMRGKWVPCHFE